MVNQKVDPSRKNIAFFLQFPKKRVAVQKLRVVATVLINPFKDLTLILKQHSLRKSFFYVWIA